MHDLAFEKWSLSIDPVDPDPGCPFDTQGKLARTSAIDADDLGGDAEVEEVSLLCAPRVDVLNPGTIYILSLADEQLPIRTDEGRCHRHAGDRHAIYTGIWPLCRSAFVDMCEERRYIRSTG